MNRYYLIFKPENFAPVLEGTILRYLGHNYNKDSQDHTVVLEVIGMPPEGIEKEIPQVQFVN